MTAHDARTACCATCRWYGQHVGNGWHLCTKNFSMHDALNAVANNPKDREVYVYLLAKIVVAMHHCSNYEPGTIELGGRS